MAGFNIPPAGTQTGCFLIQTVRTDPAVCTSQSGRLCQSPPIRYGVSGSILSPRLFFCVNRRTEKFK